mmetsp:Transcript_26330/g.63464  ORF Transcript_26330/g.63464 Transcript_26330/m.63464 type:complete len:508 (-) Transcript_26330:331-1854(-)|eukprot:CAMPEP_0114503480 /NCGR_PEP_ID=MMETSP0109-20121206/9671_1 /TAXON_ID=29199 /ORGANISM="Chlorarachnion reptans, Strain CCCM449" /LENGTH=507 /DNA_ID=CAMNT_0001681513 /DNA_START=97 /DNA_END=1620 /DNA_ORIENTATION=-
MSLQYEQMKAVIKAAKVRWLKVEECVDILLNYRSHGFPLSSSPAQRPSPSGSVFLYDASAAADWFEDRYSWNVPGAGRYSRIDVGSGMGELVSVSNDHPNGFQRRGFWLARQPRIVLVHYLSTPQNVGNDFVERSRQTRSLSGGFANGNQGRSDHIPGPGPLYDPLDGTASYMLGNMGSEDRKGRLPEDKTAKRKARKAEVARACRRRKKAYIQSLEEKAARLQQQLNSMAKSQYGEATHRKDQDTLVQRIKDAVKGGQSDRQIHTLIQRFVGNSRKRQRNVVNQSFQTLNTGVQPGEQSKFAYWILEQAPSLLGSQSRGSAEPVQTLVQQQMKLTQHQIDELTDKHKVFRQNRDQLTQLLEKFTNLKHDLLNNLEDRYRLLDRTLQLLAPHQAAVLFSWVQENPQFMDKVNCDWILPANSSWIVPENSKQARMQKDSHNTYLGSEEKAKAVNFNSLHPLSQPSTGLQPLTSEDAQISIGEIPSGAPSGELISLSTDGVRNIAQDMA